MATKYDRVNPYEEKLKRLMNCSRLTESDQKYLNFQFERYKLRAFHIMGSAFTATFIFANLPFVKNATQFKYYTSSLALGITIYKVFTMMNNQHFEQISTPYFEKYRVK